MGATGVDRDEDGVGRERIKIGVCVMEKKVKCGSEKLCLRSIPLFFFVYFIVEN